MRRRLMLPRRAGGRYRQGHSFRTEICGDSPDAVSFPHHTRLLRERLHQALTSLLQTTAALVGMHVHTLKQRGIIACMLAGGLRRRGAP